MTDFESKVLEYLPKLKGFSARYYNNSEDQDDLCQETIFKALKNQESFQVITGATVSAFLYRVMQNIFINTYRKKQLNKVVFDSAQAFEYTLPSDENIMTKFDVDDLYKAIEKLSPYLKDTVKLRLKGYSYNEIAQIQNVEIGTVKSRLFLCKKELSKLIEA
jgi:RNA polymerase sigma factor (sigma-70 family)